MAVTNNKIVTVALLALNNGLANQYADNADAALKTLIDAVSARIATLEGEEEGSVRKIVADAIAGIVADAPESLNTLKEISDWLTSHASDAAAMNTAIQKNTSDVTSLNERIDALEAADITIATEADIRALWKRQSEENTETE